MSIGPPLLNIQNLANLSPLPVNYSEKRSHDFLTNLERLKDRKIWPNFINQDSELPSLDSEDIIIDAIFGIGLNRPPDQWVERLIQHLNDSSAFVVSVDVPSGLFLDQAVKNSEAVVKANYVLSFQFPKLIFFLPETGRSFKNNLRPYIRECTVFRRNPGILLQNFLS